VEESMMVVHVNGWRRARRSRGKFGKHNRRCVVEGVNVAIGVVFFDLSQFFHPL